MSLIASAVKEFAKALRLARAAGCEAFVSFDQRSAAAANLLSEVKMRTL
jgi:hypothetical protein